MYISHDHAKPHHERLLAMQDLLLNQEAALVFIKSWGCKTLKCPHSWGLNGSNLSWAQALLGWAWRHVTDAYYQESAHLWVTRLTLNCMLGKQSNSPVHYVSLSLNLQLYQKVFNSACHCSCFKDIGPWVLEPQSSVLSETDACFLNSHIGN